jgi:hypothetical protein
MVSRWFDSTTPTKIKSKSNIMKTLQDFKKAIQIGKEIETIHARLGSFGKRKISIVQSNSFALETVRNGETVNSWCQYPKAKDIEFKNENTAVIYWGEGEKREQILTYIFN